MVSTGSARISDRTSIVGWLSAMPTSRLVELAFLLLLCFFLPLYEAPKSIAWVLYIAAWIRNRVKSGDAGGRWDTWDSLIAAWVCSAFLVAVFAGLHGSEWHGSLDIVRYTSIFWVVKRARYGWKEMQAVLFMLLLSTLLGLAGGYWALLKGHRIFLEINSIGQVNYTAIYLSIVVGGCAAWIYTSWRPIAIAAFAALFVSLFVTASRGAIGVTLILLVGMAALWWPKSRAPIVVASLTVLLSAAIALSLGLAVIRKQEADVEANNVLSFRDGIWRVAIEAWQRYPLFGVGIDNYPLLRLKRIKAWHQQAGTPFDEKRYVEAPHAHSLYLNVLAERGLVGAVAVAAVLLTWFRYLVRYRPQKGSSEQDCLLWGAAASAWTITVGVGVVNTGLHHEDAILTALSLGMWLSHIRYDDAGGYEPASARPGTSDLDG